MKTMVFEALHQGNAGTVYPGDICVTVTSAGGKNRFSLCVRFTEATLDTLRWRAGDMLRWEIEFHDDCQLWKFQQVVNEPGKRKKGLKLSQNKGSNTATVKRTVKHDQSASIFCRGHERYAGYLESGDRHAAVFKVSYDQQDK